MKLLVIGDFHGKFPKKFETLIKKEKIDLVVSNGDYFPFGYRKLWFKHCYGTDLELWEVIGKKKYKELILKDLKEGERAIKKLNNLKVPVFTIYGNLDYTRKFADNQDFDFKRKWKWDNQDFFKRILKKYKNIKRFDYKSITFKDYVFIGTYGSTNRGDPKSKAYKRNKKKMEKLFNKFKRENRQGRVIFVGHNVPFNTKLDKISERSFKFALKSLDKETRKSVQKRKSSRHYGSKMIRALISKYKPFLYLGGHMHESLGKDKIGKTVLINPGAAHEGRAAVVELDEGKKGKVKSVKFVK